MADFSFIKTPQVGTIDWYDTPLLGILSPVIVELHRYDILNWVAATGTANDQLLITDSGWYSGMAVSIIMPGGVVLQDTIDTITEGASFTKITFTTYNSYAANSLNVFAPYANYKGEIKLVYETKALSQNGGAIDLPTTEEIVSVRFSPSGMATFDLGEWMRTKLNRRYELVPGPIEGDEVRLAGQWVNLTAMYVRPVCDDYTGTYGWDGVDGDSASAVLFDAEEPYGQRYYPARTLKPAQPVLLSQAIYADGGDMGESGDGGLMWPLNSRPMWRYLVREGRVPYYFSVISGRTFTNGLISSPTSEQLLGWGMTANTKSLIRGNYTGIDTLTMGHKLYIEASSTTLGSTWADILMCGCPLRGLLWVYKGMYLWWLFEVENGELATYEGAKSYGAMPLSPLYGNEYGIADNVVQKPYAMGRTVADSQRVIQIKEEGLSAENLRYVQTLLGAERVWLMEYPNNISVDAPYPDTFVPIELVSGDTSEIRSKTDTYNFTAKLRLPQ